MRAVLPTSGVKFWTFFSLLLLAAVLTLDISLGEDIRLFGAYLLPIFVAGLTTTPRRTAFVGALALATMFSVAALTNHSNHYTELAIRLVVAFVGAALALQTAVLRERDLRSRRRLALMNIARTELEASAGLEDDLMSFARAASDEFADWAILDIRIQDGSATRTICHGERVGVDDGDSMPRKDVTAAAAAYEARAASEGPMILHRADERLMAALFEDHTAPKLRKADVLVLPITVGSVAATYFLVCPDPYPPWGAAELTQADLLARAAALAARRDQLIDQLSYAQEELQASQDQVTAIIRGIADGVTAQSSDGTMIYANEKAAEMLGFDSADEIMGRDFSKVHPRMELRDERGDPFDPNQLPSRRALAGELEPEALLRYTVIASGREWWTLVKARAIFGDDGEPLMAISIIEDQTAQRMQDLGQRILADTSKQLGEATGLQETIELVASAAVPDIADWCAIEMLAGHAKLYRNTIAGARPDKLLNHEKHASPAAALEVATTGVPELHKPGTENIAELIDFEHSDADAEVQSAMIVPIFDRGRPVGAITFALVRPGTRFTEFDLETALEYGRRAGVAIESARDAADRARMLETLRSSLLPRELPQYPNLELAARFRAAQAEIDVSGDFYDAFTLPDGSIALVIGDVCGKGPEAAAITALTRYTIRTDAMTKIHPASILRTLNQALIDQVSPDTFCTVAIARISKSESPDAHSIVEVVSGGHPLPLLVTDGVPQSIGTVGTLLGVVPEPELPVETLELKNGTSLILYTDGLSAGYTTDDLGYAMHLANQVEIGTAEETAAAIDNAAIASQTRPNRDDVAILVARLLND